MKSSGNLCNMEMTGVTGLTELAGIEGDRAAQEVGKKVDGRELSRLEAEAYQKKRRGPL